MGTVTTNPMNFYPPDNVMIFWNFNRESGDNTKSRCHYLDISDIILL